MNLQNLKYQLLADLLATLEAEEFPIGIGKHLNLQQLISKLPEDIKPEEMKTLLCPLFAKSKQDQAYFYELFDQSLNRVKAKNWEPKDEEAFSKVEDVNKWEKWLKLIGGLLLLSFAAFIYLRSTGDEPLKMPEPLRHSIAIEEGNQYQFSLTDLYKDKTPEVLDTSMKIQYVSFADGQNIKADSSFGNYQIDSNGLFSIQVLDSVTIRNTIDTIFAKYEIGIDTTILNINVLEERVEETTPEEATIDTLTLRQHPSPNDLAQLFPEQEPFWITWFNNNKYWFKPLLTFLIMLLFGLLFSWLDERDQRIIADIQSKDDPPLLWNIEVPNVGKLGLNEDYFKVLHQMRQRTNDDYVVLDIPKTVKKTVEQGGVIDFQYAYKTRPPEYLLLIDRQNSKNHRALFYNFIYESFKGDEVFIERFFYEGDIRLCWNETFPNGIKLQDLQQSHRDARLIIIGNGFQFLNPRTGKLAKWTRIFDAWRDKAVLSPRPTKEWGGRERQLERKFILLPASVQSLTLMVDKMEAVDPDEIKTKLTDKIIEPIEFQGDLIETLHHYFSHKKEGGILDDRMVQWIAACAIYPSLHWDLTMFLGKELSDDDFNLLTLDQVLQLTRLPWFVDGKIPEQARLELLEYLPEATELKLRESLQQLFDTVALPSENSVAHSDARMNIALNDYLLKKDNRDKKEYEQYLKAGTEADITMLKYLDGEKSPKDFEVDSKWKKYAQGEKPDREMNWLDLTLAYLCIFLVGLLWWYSPTFDGCGGEIVEFKELELCIKDKKDRLIYREHQVRELIEKGGYDQAEKIIYQSLLEYGTGETPNEVPLSLIKDSLQTRINDLFGTTLPELNNDTFILQFNNNISVDFYNQGVPLMNSFFKMNLEGNPEGLSFDSLTNGLCEAFDLAQFYAGQGNTYQDYKKLRALISPLCSRNALTPRKILAKEVTGQVLDKTSNEPLGNVVVTMLSQNTETDAKGRFVLNVPKNIPNVGDRNVTISYTREGLKNYSKRYAALNWMVRKEDSQQRVDIGKIFMSVEPDDQNTNDNQNQNVAITQDCQDFLEEITNYSDVIDMAERDDDINIFIKSAYERISSLNDCNLKGENLKIFKQNEKDIYRAIEKKDRMLDIRDGQVYKTTLVGDQTWMTENLNYNFPDSKCYDNDSKNCEEYGRLYSIEKINGLCPSGWRVPTDDDFQYLIKKYGKYIDKIKPENPEEQKLYEETFSKLVTNFNFQLGGSANTYEDYFNNLGLTGNYLTSSLEGGEKVIIYRNNSKDELSEQVGIYRSLSRGSHVSCRCVKGPRYLQSNTQQSQQQKNKAATLEIEIWNTITKKNQTGYEIEIEGIDQNLIKGNSTNWNFSAPVLQGKEYTLIAKVDGKEKERKTILMPKQSQYKIIWELGLPVILDKEEPSYDKNNLPDLEMVTIPSGTFMMGNEDGRGNEKPVHKVTIRSFKMAKYEVTQRLYEVVMGENPSEFKGCEKCPVENVSWNDAQAFIKRLNELTGQRYRLPSETEWEYAARGGENYQYAGSNELDKVGWYNSNSNDKTHPVGGLQKNGYGLFDMSGNVFEWTEDCWNRNYNNAPTNQEAWLNGKGADCPRRVVRGGSWYLFNIDCRVSYRYFNDTDYRSNFNGFRVAQD